MTHQLFLGEPSAVAAAVVGSLAAPRRRRGASRRGRRAAASGRALLRRRRRGAPRPARGDGRRPGAGCAAGSSSVTRRARAPRRGSSSCRRSPRATATSRRSRRRPSSASTRSCRGRRSAPSSSGAASGRPSRSPSGPPSWPGRPSSPAGRVCRSTSPAVGLAPLVARVAESALHARAARGRHRAAGDGGRCPESGDVLVVVGPEGGITDREIEALTAAGARAVRLGSTILRASSAGPAALAVLSAPHPLALTAYAPLGQRAVRGRSCSATVEPSLALALEDAQHVGACRQRLLRRERVRTPGGGTLRGGGEAAGRRPSRRAGAATGRSPRRCWRHPRR